MFLNISSVYNLIKLFYFITLNKQGTSDFPGYGKLLPETEMNCEVLGDHL